MYYRKSFIISLAAAMAVCSCSIKEDRWPCPCWLVFQSAGETPLPESGAFTVTVFPEGSSIEEKTAQVSWQSLQDNTYDVSVSKGYKVINSIMGISKQTLSGSDVIISEGMQADSLYSFSSRVECLGEEAMVPVRMDKQYATVFLRMENDSDSYPFDLRVRGEVNGMSLLTLEPHFGRFSLDCTPFAGGNEFRFRLPRQKDGSLVLELREKGMEPGSSPLETIPLGQYIIESGFDWTKASLDDIYIGVDYARAGIRITVGDWETVLQVTEEI